MGYVRVDFLTDDVMNHPVDAVNRKERRWCAGHGGFPQVCEAGGVLCEMLGEGVPPGY